MVQEIDILNVASSLGFTLNDEQVSDIVAHYSDLSDPTATWDLIVEQMIYELVSLATLKVTIEDIISGDTQVVGIDWILNEINRDRSGKWTNYDETDWREGWYEWCEGDIYKIINLEN